MWSDSHGNVSQLNTDSQCIFQSAIPSPTIKHTESVKIG